MNNKISGIKKKTKHTLEGMTSRLDEADNQISGLDDKVEKNTKKQQEKEKRLRKNEEVVRELQDNMKHNNIHIIGITEGEEKAQGRESIFEKIMTENFPNVVRKKVTQLQEAHRVPMNMNHRSPLQDTSKLKW